MLPRRSIRRKPVPFTPEAFKKPARTSRRRRARPSRMRETSRIVQKASLSPVNSASEKVKGGKLAVCNTPCSNITRLKHANLSLRSSISTPPSNSSSSSSSPTCEITPRHKKKHSQPVASWFRTSDGDKLQQENVNPNVPSSHAYNTSATVACRSVSTDAVLRTRNSMRLRAREVAPQHDTSRDISQHESHSQGVVASHVRATGPMSTDVVASHDASLPSSSVCDVVPKRRGTARDRGGQGMKNHRKRITRSATRTYAASSVHMCEDSPLKGKRDDNVDERDDNVVKPVVSTSLVLSDSEDCEITKCSPKASTRSTGRVQRSSRGGVCEVSQEIGRNEADVRPTKMASVRVSDSEDCEITPVYAEKTGTSTVSVRRDAESEDCEITPNEGKSIRKEKEIIEHIALSLSSPEPAEYIENMEVKISPSPFKSWPSPSRGRDVGVKIAPLRPTVQTYGKRRKVGQDLHLPSMRALGVKTKSPSVSGRSDSEQGDNSSKSWDEEAHAHPERSGERESDGRKEDVVKVESESESESEEDAIRKEECVAPMKPGDARLNAFMMEQRRLWDEVDLLDLEEELN